ncbi:MAG TPA: hypothetical protein VL614_12145 [Acetobacteraceae bacterium]|jgi:hypothetical protein|nr:hypothetical protein [Acetobacteraceae bacterium]
MRRLGAVVVLAGAAALLSGCVYDPYTGGYYPCCSYYGNPAYRYPPPYYPPPQGYPAGPPPVQGYPYAPPPAQQQGSYQGQPLAPSPQPLAPPPPAPGATAYPGNGAGGGLAQRFANANVSHDGRLTLQQAEAGMPMVARNFDSIDIEHKGYVTLPEIRAFAAERRAAGQTATE